MTNTLVYWIGFAILIAGVLYAASLLHVSDKWMVVIALVLAGIGIVAGITKTRSKEPPVSS
ncbi:MAG: hypothetical protein ACE15D_05050 [Candidatus Eisenbacteria bacterium]|nr:hypothetical protein [Candidatus Eisenbacteria bacterium]